MKKKILCIGLVMCMVLAAFTGCGKKDDEVVYDYDYDLTEYITIGDYEGIEYTPEPFVVDTGDTASIEYQGLHNGEAFEGGTGSYDLVIGSGSFIPGFEDGLIGYTAGDYVSLDLTFPDPYENNPDLAGQPVVFNVTIGAINGYTEEGEQDQEIVWNKFFESCEIIKYPEKELNATIEQQQEYYETYAEAYGMEFDEFLEMMGTTKEEFDADVKEYAEKMVAQDMALYALARTAGIEASEEAIEEAKAQMLETYGVADEKEFKQTYGIDFEDDTVQNSLEMTALLQTTLDFLVETAKEVEL